MPTRDKITAIHDMGKLTELTYFSSQSVSQRANRLIYFPSTYITVSTRKATSVFLSHQFGFWISPYAQSSSSDAWSWLPPPVWSVIFPQMLLGNELAEARKRHPHLIQHGLKWRCCPPRGYFMSRKDGISLWRLRSTFITELI